MAPRWRVSIQYATGAPMSTYPCGESQARRYFSDTNPTARQMMFLQRREKKEWITVDQKGLRVAR
jgi:hypothetical protein